MELNEGGFTIVSWNINGLRTLEMKEVLEKRLEIKCAILAVQETKLTKSDLRESQALVDNYTSYFSFCKSRAGYSGVATYCRNDALPIKAEDGIGGTNLDKNSSSAVGNYCDIEEFNYSHVKFGDEDGRSVITQHVVVEPDGTEKVLNVINVYCPRLRDDPSDHINNTEFKSTFHNILGNRAVKMVENGEFVLIVGDLNISHKFQDQSCAETQKEFIQTEFRQWLDDLCTKLGFKDTFRVKFPDRIGAFTCWNTKLNARENNFGSRIDYVLADPNIIKYLENAEIHQSVKGSDHCPISATFHSLRPKAASAVPKFSSKFYFGKQQNLVDLFKKQQSTIVNLSKVGDNEKEQRKRPADMKLSKSTKQLGLMSFFTKKPRLDKSPSKGISDEADVVATTPTTSNNLGTFYQEVNSSASAAWRQIMKTPQVPLCTGHTEPCVLRTTRRSGANYGRQFFACARGTGKTNDPNSNCNFFKWAK